MTSPTRKPPTRTFNHVVTESFGRIAHTYDTALLQYLLYRPPQDQVIAELRAAGSRRIADIGCGTGILSTRIAEELTPDEVFGIDASPGMLARARERSTRVRWIESPAERLPFDAAELDAVVSTSAFHFFDQPAALAEFARVLAPGGLTAIATFHSAGPLTRPVLRLARHPIFPSYSPSPRELRKLLAEAGFEVLDQRRVHRPLPRPLIPDLITVGRR